MENSTSNHHPHALRRAIYSALIAAAASVIGATLARPIVESFADYPSWLLPVIAAGIVGTLVMAL
ncbi:MAG: hypothetical protein ABIO63_00825, partial [Casimicrobiaceae bacterium]